MALPTPVGNISVSFTILAALSQSKGFGIPLLIVPLSTNSLNGDRVRTYNKLSDAKADKTAGYISTLTYAAMVVAFGQTASPAALTAPSTVKVGYVNDNADVPATKAFKDADTAGTGAFDTVIEAHVAGTAGNSIEVIWIGDSGAGVTIEVLNSGLTVIIHYKAATSTVTNVETAITALSGANDVIDVKTGGTGATVLAAADAANMVLAGGTDAVPTETYGDAYDAIAAEDPNFFGVAITSRDDGDQLSCAQAIAAGAGDVVSQRIGFFQTSGGASGAAAGDLATALAIGPVSFWYHDIDTEWADVARMCSRLCYDPNSTSYSFQGPIDGVAAYATTLDSTQTGNLNTNFINWMGSEFGGGDFWMQPGVNGQGTEFDFYVTAYWYTANVSQNIGTYWTRTLVSGKKVTLDQVGQQAALGFAKGQWTTGMSIGHFTGNAVFTVSANTDTSTITVNGATQLDEDAKKINVITTGSTSPVT